MAFYADLLAGLDLVFDVEMTGRIFSDENDRQSRTPQSSSGVRFDPPLQIFPDRLGNCLAIQQLRGLLLVHADFPYWMFSQCWKLLPRSISVPSAPEFFRVMVPDWLTTPIAVNGLSGALIVCHTAC